MSPPAAEPGSSLRLYRWNDRKILGAGLAALAGGFGQFGAVAALGDVAKAFGQVTHGATIAQEAGLSGTTLGIGLAVIRLASLGGLPVAGLADRFGRRRVLLISLGGGLALTALAAASQGYWWFVAIFALGRPMLSGADAVSQVYAGEQTGPDDRTKAIALIAAGYGVGAGITAILHSVAIGGLGFRGLFLLALAPLATVGLIRRWITEPDRFNAIANAEHPLPVVGAVGNRFRGRLAVIAGIAFALAVITGPANSFVFLYADDFVHQPGYLTALMVVGAGASGLIGLILGRWLADRLGRRPTAALGMVGITCFGIVAYSGSTAGLFVGYIFGVLTGSMIAPAAGAMVNELFPTAVRASVAGWWVAAGVLGATVGLVVFGAVADVRNQFLLAATVTFLPASAAAWMFWLLPETRGLEPEQVAAS
ncbi:MAG TPA: MFS transporter [Acidimicrobiales bacterium]|nr:MFS transporter [Acidimicrobiales bacterium]